MSCSIFKTTSPMETVSMPRSCKDFLALFNDGVNRDAIPSFVKEDNHITFITAFWYVFQSYVKNGAKLTFFTPNNAILVHGCSLEDAYDEVRIMGELPELGKRDVPKHQIVNLFATLVEIVNPFYEVFCFRIVKDVDGNVLKPSFTVGVANSTGTSFVADWGSSCLRICDGTTGVFLTEAYVIEAIFNDLASHGDDKYDTYVSTISSYVDQHIPHVSRDTIPFRFTGVWRENKDWFTLLKTKLIAVGFTDVKILSTTDEGKMEARAATTISSAHGVVFAAGGGSTQVTLA